MNIYFLTSGNHNTSRKNVIKTSLLMLFLTPFMLGGCGSDDKLPGGSNPGDQDPLATGTPLFYIQRQIDTDNQDELNDPLRYLGAATLVKKARADQAAPEVILSDYPQFSGAYDFRDLDISFDGMFLLFAARAPDPDPDDDDVESSWNIWQYDIENDTLERVMPTTIEAEKGHDITPRYLPTGDIVFASTRQQKSRAVLLDEGKAAYAAQEESRQQAALNLHVMEGDGTSIRQITFNQSHDFYPVVMLDGKIIYSRWDRYGRDDINLYRTNADGTETEILYGMHSHDTGSNNSDIHFIKSNILPSGDLFVLARPMDSDAYGGDFITIDYQDYVENNVPTDTTNGSGPAQQSITNTSVTTDSAISLGGYYADYFPLWDGTSRALASWSQCRLNIGSTVVPCTSDNLANSSATAASPSYGVWMVNYDENTQVPVLAARSGYVYTDVVLGAERDIPQPYIDGSSLTGDIAGTITAITMAELVDPQNEEAVLHIRSVYDLDGTANASYSDWSNPSLTDADDRPARFLRIIKAVPEPSRDVKRVDNNAFGLSNAQRMKEIIGYAPIEPDGSVKVRVPANVALMISYTDKNGKRIGGRHQNWISLRPGEVMECKGCHTRGSTLPHGRYGAQAATINSGRPTGSSYTGADPSVVSPYAFATMAEAKADASMDTINDSMILSTDLLYSDTWTDTASETADPDWMLRYADMPNFADMSTNNSLPYNSNCSPWNGRCRIIINYEEHIQPLWEYARANLASDGNPATCIRCHSRTDDMGAAQLPAGQLELTTLGNQADGIRVQSYVELFTTDVEQELVGGAVQDTQCVVGQQEVPVLDINGDPTFDIDGNPITMLVDILQTCDPSISPSMSSNGALASRFFDVFEGVGSHVDYMTPAELRLIAEWLDIGGQYYNNHFDAPDAN